MLAFGCRSAINLIEVAGIRWRNDPTWLSKKEQTLLGSVGPIDLQGIWLKHAEFSNGWVRFFPMKLEIQEKGRAGDFSSTAQFRTTMDVI